MIPCVSGTQQVFLISQVLDLRPLQKMVNNICCCCCTRLQDLFEQQRTGKMTSPTRGGKMVPWHWKNLETMRSTISYFTWPIRMESDFRVSYGFHVVTWCVELQENPRSEHKGAFCPQLLGKWGGFDFKELVQKPNTHWISIRNMVSLMYIYYIITIIYTQYSFLKSVHHPAIVNEDAAVFKTLQDSGNTWSQPRVSQLHPTAWSWGELWIQYKHQQKHPRLNFLLVKVSLRKRMCHCGIVEVEKIYQFMSFMSTSCLFFPIWIIVAACWIWSPCFRRAMLRPSSPAPQKTLSPQNSLVEPSGKDGACPGDTIRFVGNSSALEKISCDPTEPEEWATCTFDIRWCGILAFMKHFSSAASAVCSGVAWGLTLILGRHDLCLFLSISLPS